MRDAINLIIVALLASIVTLAAADLEPVVSYAGDSYTVDSDTGAVEIVHNGEVMELEGRVVLVYQNGELQNGKRYPALDTLPFDYALAYLARVIGWRPVYLLRAQRIYGAANPVADSDTVIVFETDGRKYVPVPPELQPVPTPENPSPSGGGMS